MPTILLVMSGGAIGAALRYGANSAIPTSAATGWPWATLVVNIVGGFLMGLLVALGSRFGLADGWRLFLGVGVLGGFTTFSAFTLEMVTMLEGGRAATAALYAGTSIIGALVALALGSWLVRAL